MLKNTKKLEVEVGNYIFKIEDKFLKRFPKLDPCSLTCGLIPMF
mgnify:CR=1 FL=1